MRRLAQERAQQEAVSAVGREHSLGGCLGGFEHFFELECAAVGRPSFDGVEAVDQTFADLLDRICRLLAVTQCERRSTHEAAACAAQAETILAKLAEETTAAQENLAELKQKAADREAARAKRSQARLDLAAARKVGKEKRSQEKALEAEANKKLK